MSNMIWALGEAVDEQPRELTEAEKNQLNADLVALYVEGKYDFPEMEEPVLEGANLDMRKTFNDAMKESKTAIKSAIKKLKGKNADKAGAKADLKTAKDAINKAKKIIKDTDSTVLEAFIGFYARGVHEVLKILPLLLAAPFTLGVTGIVATISTTIDGIKDIITGTNDIIEASKSKEGIKPKNLNLYRGRLLSALDDAMHSINKLEKEIK